MNDASLMGIPTTPGGGSSTTAWVAIVQPAPAAIICAASAKLGEQTFTIGS